MCRQGKRGECVSSFSGGRVMRVKTLHKYLSFSMPEAPPLSSPPSLLEDTNPFISHCCLSNHLFFPSSFFSPSFRILPHRREEGKTLIMHSPFFAPAHPPCLSLPVPSLSCSFPAPPLHPLFLPVFWMSLMRERETDRQTERDDVRC